MSHEKTAAPGAHGERDRGWRFDMAAAGNDPPKIIKRNELFNFTGHVCLR